MSVQRSSLGAIALLAAVGLLCTASLPSLAQNQPRAEESQGAAAPTWAALNTAQRETLAPLAERWDRMSSDRRNKWLDMADRMRLLPAQDQVRIRQRMTDWAAMSPAERAQARQRYQEARNLSGAERKAWWDAYTALPESERRSLVERGRARSEPAPGSEAPRRPQGLMSSPADLAEPKRKFVPLPPPSAAPPRPVSPTQVKPGPGATTVPINREARPPAHQQPGQPKIAAQPHQVDRSTLLPRRGPQAASVPAAPVQR